MGSLCYNVMFYGGEGIPQPHPFFFVRMFIWRPRPPLKWSVLDELREPPPWVHNTARFGIGKLIHLLAYALHMFNMGQN